MADLDAKGICDIIKACHKAGVKQLKLADMCVTFVEESTKVSPWISPEHVYGPNSANPTLGTEIPEEELKPQTLMTAEQKEMLRDIEDAQMLVDNPVGFEKRMIDSYLESPRQPTPEELEGMDA